MFGIVTNRFLGEAHYAFMTLRFFPKGAKDMDYAHFFETAINTLNHTRSLADAVVCLEAFCYARKNFKKIKRLIERNPGRWLRSSSSERNVVQYTDDKEAGYYFLATNVLDAENPLSFAISNVGFAGGYRACVKEGDTYAISENARYYLKPPSKDSKDLDLYERATGKLLATLCLKGGYALSFKMNETDYQAVEVGAMTGFVRKGYPVVYGVPIEPKDILGTIVWDVLDGGKSDLAVIKITNNQFKDVDFLLTVGLALLILYCQAWCVGYTPFPGWNPPTNS